MTKGNDEWLYVENPAPDQLQEDQNWSYKDGRELAPENSNVRGSFKEVVLIPNFEKAIKRIIKHSWFPLKAR